MSASAQRHRLAVTTVEALKAQQLTLATCESLTAGAVAATLASVPGASVVLKGGLITYATQLKTDLAGVDADLLAARGAVDPDVAVQMAEGARTACVSSLGIACTGVAGPAPQDGVLPGTVFIALAHAGAADVAVEELALTGDREEIREATVIAALNLVLRSLRA